MKLKPNLPAVLVALVTSIMPTMALTWNDGGPTNNWSTASGDTNWIGNVTWTNGSAADFAASGTDTIALATDGMTAGTVTFDAASSYNINTNGSAMTWAALSGSGGFTKSGTGTLTLNGAGGASGTISLTDGQITVGGASALGTTSVAVDGATAILAANGNSISNAVTLSNGGKLSTTAGSTVFSAITLGTGGGQLAGGTGNYGIFTGKVTGGTAGETSLTINSGHTQLNNTTNDFAGNILINGNYYLKTVTSDTIPDTAVITLGGGGGWKLQPAAGGTYTETLAGIEGIGYQIWAEGSGVNATFRIGFGDVSSVFGDTLTQVGGATLAIEKIGSGSLTLSGGNGYTGTTTVTAGTLIVANANAISNGGTVIVANTAGAILQLNNSKTLGSIAGGGAAGGEVNLQANTLTVGNASNTSFAGSISGTGGGLAKVGSGILTLSGVSAYTGVTTIDAGTLSVTGSLHADSTVAVGTAGSLTGTGAINGTLNSSGIIAPGIDATPAILTVGKDLFLDGGTLKFDVSGTACDKIQLSGTSTVTTNQPVAIQLSGVTGVGDYILIDGASDTIDIANFTTTVNGLFAVVLDNTTPGKLIAHVVSGATLVWNGGSGNATWDIGSSSNWLNGAAATTYADTNHVSFTNAAAEKNVVLDAMVAPGSMVVNNTNSYSITGSGSITGATGIVKQGVGSLTLDTVNTYSGVTAIEAGTVVLGDWEALGSTAGNTTVSSGATLDLNGQPGIVAEPIVLNGAGVSGVGALINGDSVNSVSLSGAVALNSVSSIGGSGNLTLSGAITGSNGMTKVGGGILTLSSANAATFSGTVNVNDGTLKLGNGDALGADHTTAGKIVVASGATFDVNAASDPRYGVTISGAGVGANGAYINTGGATSLGAIQIPNITLAANASIGGTGNFAMIAPGHAPNSLNLAGNTLTKVGNNTFYLSTTTVSFGTIDIQAGAIGVSAQAGTGASDGGAAAFIVGNGGSLILARSFNVGSLGGGGTAGGTVSLGVNTLTVGADNTSPAAFAGIITGSGAISKIGTGTLALAGANTYTGSTTVNTGTLHLVDDGQLKFAIGATSGVSNSISGAGTVLLDGDFSIDTTAAAALTSGTWSLEDVPSLAGAYGATFTVAGFADAGSNKWTKTEGSKLWTFDETTGVLTLGSAANYAAWAATNAGGGTADQDFDNDGVKNGIEYFMGQAGSSMTSSPAMVNNTITWPKDPSANATYVIETSTNLAAEVTPGDGGWVPATNGIVDNGTSVQYTVPTGAPKRFVRLKVTIP